jgi:transcriptional regulator with XRE-family HTH domain
MFDFGNHLKKMRQSKNITQRQLAEFIGASERGIQNYELNVRKPNFDIIIKLCRYFDVSADYLLGLSDEPERR